MDADELRLKQIVKEAITEYFLEEKERQKISKKVTTNQDNESISIMIKNILAFLNLRCDKNFGLIKSNLELIEARILKSKDISPVQALGIINMQADNWIGTDFSKYLRPATLFNKTKCNNYLGELGSFYRYRTMLEAINVIEILNSKLLNEEELKQFIRTTKSANSIINDSIIIDM